MKKNLLYMLMLLAMPMAFVACGDDEDGDVVTNVNASGVYTGQIVMLVNDENLFTVANPDATSSAIEFNLVQNASTTNLSIDDVLEHVDLGIQLAVDNIPSTATSEKLTLNGTDMDLEKEIIGIGVIINSVTGTVDKNGKANLNITATAPALDQDVKIEITAQKK